MTNYIESPFYTHNYFMTTIVNPFNHYQNNLLRKQASTKRDFEIQMNSAKNNIRFYQLSNKESASSIDSYNKSSSKPLVANNFSLNKLLKSFFNMLPVKKVVFNPRKDNKVRYSANRVYTGKPELEHTSLSNVFLTKKVTFNIFQSALKKELIDIIPIFLNFINSRFFSLGFILCTAYSLIQSGVFIDISVYSTPFIIL